MPTRTATIIFRVVSNEYIRKIDEITRKTHDLERATDRLSSGTARRAARAQETVNRKYQQQTREIQELIRNKRSLAQQTLTLIRNLGGMGRVTDIVASKFKYLAGGAVVGFLIYQMAVLGGRLRAVRDYFTDITVAQEGLYRGDAEDQNRQTVDRFRQASGGAVSNVTLESIGAQTARLGLNPKGMAVIIHKMVEQAILTGVGNIDQLVNSRFGSLRQGDLGILEELIIGTGDDPTRGRTALGLINSQTTRELQRNESVLAELTKTLGRVPTQLEVNGEKLRRITNEIAKAAEQGEVSLDNSFIGIERIRAEFTNAISEISLLFEPIINFLANTVADFFSGIKEHAEGLNRFIANTKSFIENSPLFQYSEEQKEVHKQRAEREERQIAALTASHPRVARALYPDRPEFNSTEQQPDPYAQERQAAAAISLAEQNKKLLDQTIAVEIATGKASIKMESFVSDINAVERAFSANILEKLGGSGIGIRPDDGRNPLSGGEGFFRGSQIVDFKDLKSITSFSLAVEGVADATESAQLELREWLIDIEIARDFFLNSTLARTGGGVIGIQTAASRDPLAGGSFFGGTSLSASDLENAKNEEAEARRKETQARQRQRQELVLLSSVLDSINPKLGTIGKNFLAVHASIQLLSNPSTGAFGVLGAGAAIFTASLTILNTVFGQGKSQADKLREAEQRLANQRSQAAAGFSNVLSKVEFEEFLQGEDFNIPEYIRRTVRALPATIIGSLGSGDFLKGSEELQRLIDQGINKNDYSELFRRLYEVAPDESDPVIQRIHRTVIERQRAIGQVEVDARREQSQIIIEEIERQRREVLDRYRNAEEAKRQAATRAVKLTFDLLEVDLRTQYTKEFTQAGGSPSAREVTRERLFKDIDQLRGNESATLTHALNEISQSFNQQRDQANEYFDALRTGVENAINDLSVDFDTALQTHVSQALSDLNKTQGSFLTELKKFAPNFATQWETVIQPKIDTFYQASVVTPIKTAIENGTTATNNASIAATTNAFVIALVNALGFITISTPLNTIVTNTSYLSTMGTTLTSIKTNSALLLGISGNIALIYTLLAPGGSLAKEIGTMKDNIASFSTSVATALESLTFPTPQVTVNQGDVNVSVSVDQAGNTTETVTTEEDEVITSNPTPTKTPPGTPTAPDSQDETLSNFGGKKRPGPRVPPGFIPGPNTPPGKFPPLI